MALCKSRLRDVILILSAFISGFYTGYMMESNLCDPVIDNHLSNQMPIYIAKYPKSPDMNKVKSLSSIPAINDSLPPIFINESLVKSNFFDETYEWQYFKNRNTETSAYFIPDKNLIFCGIPKNAISMWKMVLLRLHDDNVAEWWLNKITEIHDSNTGLDNYRLHDQNISQVTSWMNDKSWYKATFIRDPLERALSGVQDKGYQIGITWGHSLIKYLINTTFADNKGRYLVDQHVRPQHTFCDLYKYRDKYHIFSYHNKSHRRLFLEGIGDGIWEKYGKSGWSPDDHPVMNKDGIQHDLTNFGNVFIGHSKNSKRLIMDRFNMKITAFLLDYYRYDYILFDLPIPQWICGIIDKQWQNLTRLIKDETVKYNAILYKRKTYLEDVRTGAKLRSDFIELYTVLNTFPVHLHPSCMEIIIACAKYGQCVDKFGFDYHDFKKLYGSQVPKSYKRVRKVK